MYWRNPILVLDADPIGGRQVAEVLVAAGLEASVVTTPEALLREATTGPATVMIVEVPTQGMSESVLLSTAERMTGLKVMPIVVCSRQYPESSPVAKSLLSQGAVDFVGRPSGSARWRAAIARALNKLQTESAKLASMNKSNAHAADSLSAGPPAPMVFGGPNPSASSPRSGNSSQKSGPATKVNVSRAADVLSGEEWNRLKDQGLRVPRNAVVGTLLGGRVPPGPVLAWRADDETLTVVCIGHTYDQHSEVQLGFRVPEENEMREVEARIQGKVDARRKYAWGSLVRLHLQSHEPPKAYGRLRSVVDATGDWDLG